MKTHEHKGRTIQEDHGLAGQVTFTILSNSLHYFTLAGSVHGTPGPITLIVGGMQSHVTSAGRFGGTFDIEYVKRWIDAEDSAKPINVWPEAQLIECPVCNAQRGKLCNVATSTGRRDVHWFHSAREEAARP